jgi:hypothetical protein
LIKVAKGYTHENKRETMINKLVKKESKSERAFVRDRLKKDGEDADTNFGKHLHSNRWNWD